MNRYQKVLHIAKMARRQEAESRNPIEDSKAQYVKKVNEQKKRTNYVLEATLEFEASQQKKDEDE